MVSLGVCEPCQKNHVERIAAVLIDGVPQCIRCVRGDGAVRPLYAEPVCDLTAVLPPVAEPKLRRGPTLYPMHLEPQERAAHAATHSSLDTRLATVRIQPKRPPAGVPKPSSVLTPQEVIVPIETGIPAKLQQVPRYTQNAYAPVVTYLMEETATAMAMTMDDYLVHSNSPRYATVRHMAAWLIRKHTQVSLKQIGRRFGCMHHTSVMHGVRKIDSQRKTDRGLAVILDQIAESAQRRYTGKESGIRATRTRIHGALLTTCSYPDLLTGRCRMSSLLSAPFGSLSFAITGFPMFHFVVCFRNADRIKRSVNFDKYLHLVLSSRPVKTGEHHQPQTCIGPQVWGETHSCGLFCEGGETFENAGLVAKFSRYQCSEQVCIWFHPPPKAVGIPSSIVRNNESATAYIDQIAIDFKKWFNCVPSCFFGDVQFLGLRAIGFERVISRDGRYQDRQGRQDCTEGSAVLRLVEPNPGMGQSLPRQLGFGVLLLGLEGLRQGAIKRGGIVGSAVSAVPAFVLVLQRLRRGVAVGAQTHGAVLPCSALPVLVQEYAASNETHHDHGSNWSARFAVCGLWRWIGVDAGRFRIRHHNVLQAGHHLRYTGRGGHAVQFVDVATAYCPQTAGLSLQVDPRVAVDHVSDVSAVRTQGDAVLPWFAAGFDDALSIVWNSGAQRQGAGHGQQKNDQLSHGQQRSTKGGDLRQKVGLYESGVQSGDSYRQATRRPIVSNFLSPRLGQDGISLYGRTATHSQRTSSIRAIAKQRRGFALRGWRDSRVGLGTDASYRGHGLRSPRRACGIPAFSGSRSDIGWGASSLRQHWIRLRGRRNQDIASSLHNSQQVFAKVTVPHTFSLTFTRVGRRVLIKGLEARCSTHTSVPTHAACGSLLQTSDAHTGAESVSREARDRKSCAGMRLSKASSSAPSNPLEGVSGALHTRSNAMATEPVRGSEPSLSLSLSLPDPIPGDVFTHVASGPNAAIAIAAAMESADEQRLTDLMAEFATSAEFQLLKQSYRADQRRIHSDDPTNAAEREEFILDLALSRMFFAGMRYAALPKEVRRAA